MNAALTEAWDIGVGYGVHLLDAMLPLFALVGGLSVFSLLVYWIRRVL